MPNPDDVNDTPDELDDDQVTDEGTDESDEPDEVDEDESEEETDPEARIEQLEAELAKAERTIREYLRPIEKKYKKLGGDEALETLTKAQTEAAQWREHAVRSELLRSGLHVPEGREDKALSRALRQVDWDEIGFEDGKLYGLDDQIDDMKSDVPGWFRSGERRGPRGDGVNRSATTRQPKSDLELLAEQYKRQKRAG